ncbi:hypothetical protein BC826DRAFT_1080539 [Russula brevipes]|nr:hypothetical protein BC826DRAFT_1080539 [Russula brevipes]
MFCARLGSLDPSFVETITHKVSTGLLAGASRAHQNQGVSHRVMDTRRATLWSTALVLFSPNHPMRRRPHHTSLTRPESTKIIAGHIFVGSYTQAPSSDSKPPGHIACPRPRTALKCTCLPPTSPSTVRPPRRVSVLLRFFGRNKWVSAQSRRQFGKNRRPDGSVKLLYTTALWPIETDVETIPAEIHTLESETQVVVVGPDLGTSMN